LQTGKIPGGAESPKSAGSEAPLTKRAGLDGGSEKAEAILRQRGVPLHHRSRFAAKRSSRFAGRKAETCPQYRYLTADDLASGGYEGAKCICSSPPRDHADQEAV